LSTISKLGGDSLVNLPDVLARIERRLEGWEQNISLDGKNIEVANIEQPSWIAYYDQIAVEAYSISEYCEMLVKKVRAERMHYIKNQSSKDYTDSAIQRAIDGDKQFIYQQQIYLEVREVYDKCKSIVESFKQRSYSLNNIVKLRENELENITIRID
jgi:Recombination, repair and ssDNA binding protein UvsY